MNQFIVKVKYTKQLEDGTLKRVVENYLVYAVSFSDAEERAYKEIGELVKGEFVVLDIKRENFSDVMIFDDSDTIFKVKIKYKSIDADTGRDKIKTNVLLITASDPQQVQQRVKQSLLMVVYEITSIIQSNIVEVFFFRTEDK